MPKLHFLSAVVGFVIAGLLALTTSQASPPPATLNPASIRIEYMPHPRDMVQIKEGAPYTVLAGKIFVATALGRYDSNETTPVSLSVDGLTTLLVTTNSTADSRGVLDIPRGFTVPAGSVVEPFDAIPSVQRGVVWGYLAGQ
jgi:hypothetical protein